MVQHLEHEEVISSSSYDGARQRDAVIQLVRSKSGGERYRVFDNKTGVLHTERFIRLYEAKEYIRNGFIHLPKKSC